MIKKNQHFLNMLNVISDAVLVFIAYFFALYVRFDVMNGVVSLQFTSNKLLLVDFIYSLALVFAYYNGHLYESQRIRRLGSNFLLIYLTNAAGTVILASLLYVMKITDFSRILLFLFWIIASTLVWLKHCAVKQILTYYRAKGYNLKHVILVGSHSSAVKYAEFIAHNTGYGFVIDGYIGEKIKTQLSFKAPEYLGNLECISEILANRDIDELIVALEADEAVYVKNVLSAADKEGLRVEIIPFYSEYYPAHPTIESMGDSMLINMRATPLDNIAASMLKRILDIIGSLVLIILTSPVMLIVAIGVKITSPGPVLFKQERVGRNKKTFNMLKFRSMRVDINHEGWTTDEDDRKTVFGSFIRKFSLDELPQFFNVLAGQMSMVGPRPEIPKFVSQFKEEIPLYLVRQQVRPGITGLSQIRGLRGNTSIEERVKTDVWYIENWSLGLDAKIILKTIFGGMINSEKL